MPACVWRGAVVGPKEDAHVFCRAIENCEPLNAGTGDEFTLDAGDVALLRYRLIHDLVRRGAVLDATGRPKPTSGLDGGADARVRALVARRVSILKDVTMY